MKAKNERPYELVRTLPDGQSVPIGVFGNLNEAKKRLMAFSEYWPGDYVIVIVPPKYEQGTDQRGS